MPNRPTWKYTTQLDAALIINQAFVDTTQKGAFENLVTERQEAKIKLNRFQQ